MPLSESLPLRVGGVRLAHACVLDAEHTCAYPGDRGLYGMVLVTEGAAHYRFVSGAHLRAEAGDILLLSPEAAYVIDAHAPFRHHTVNFTLEGSVAPLLAEGACYRRFAGLTDPAYARAFSRLSSLWHTRRAGYTLRAVGYVYEILSMLIAEDENERYGAPIPRRLLRARTYIHEHFAEDIRVSTLAALCDLSETHVRRLFRATFGKTAMQYLEEVRMSHAEEYLSGGYYSVSEVSAMCGFSDVSYFVRCFRRYTGTTPGVYRTGCDTR